VRVRERESVSGRVWVSFSLSLSLLCVCVYICVCVRVCEYVSVEEREGERGGVLTRVARCAYTLHTHTLTHIRTESVTGTKTESVSSYCCAARIATTTSVLVGPDFLLQ
jgi:hypothetical protein